MTCHGPQGDAIGGVNLRTGVFKTAFADRDLDRVIRTGSPAGMPAFALDNAEMAGIIAYIRNMNAVDVSTVKTGDIARGRAPINTWTETAGHGAVVALDPRTGDRKWTFPMTDVTDSGILTTASDVLFIGGREGYCQALDARTGAAVEGESGAAINSGPISYRVGNKPYVSIVSGLSLSVFALDD